MNTKRQQAITNIFGNMLECWKWDNPTGSLLERAITKALNPVYPNVRHLGSGQTIVDVAIHKIAFDIKGSGALRILQKNTGSTDSNYISHIVNSKEVFIRIPKAITTQIRRPTVDLENWKGDAEKILKEQIADYENFATTSTKAEGCNQLYSLVVLYGENEKLGIQAAYISLQPFSVVYPETYHTEGKKYYGLDKNGVETFSISPMNKGSVNTFKRFDTSKGVLRVWSTQNQTDRNYSNDIFGEKSIVLTV